MLFIALGLLPLGMLRLAEVWPLLNRPSVAAILAAAISAAITWPVSRRPPRARGFQGHLGRAGALYGWLLFAALMQQEGIAAPAGRWLAGLTAAALVAHVLAGTRWRVRHAAA